MIGPKWLVIWNEKELDVLEDREDYDFLLRSFHLEFHDFLSLIDGFHYYAGPGQGSILQVEEYSNGPTFMTSNSAAGIEGAKYWR